jgi:predicted MFS family arabinose efflux permease
LGALVIPWIAAVYGFRSAFLFIFTICVLATLSVWRWLVEIAKSQATATPNRPLASPLMRLAVWRVALAGALLTVPLMAVLSFAPVFLTDLRHLNMALISVTVAVIQLGGGILRVVVGQYTDRHKNRRATLRVIALTAGVSGIALGVLADQTNYLVLPLLVGCGVAGHAWQGIAFAEIAIMSGVENAGKALGMMGTTVFGSTFLTPLLIPTLLHIGSWGTVWIAVGISSVLAIALVAAPTGVTRRAAGSSF